jgi:hypothetical protein
VRSPHQQGDIHYERAGRLPRVETTARFDVTQVCDEDCPSSRHGRRRSLVREIKRTTSNEGLPALLLELRETPFARSFWNGLSSVARRGEGWAERQRFEPIALAWRAHCFAPRLVEDKSEERE